ncbi:MAG: hypothetical protein K2X04_07315 [Burkholderiales bacterium]|nr:hypothetical protein [Burkholderiales bacterium]
MRLYLFLCIISFGLFACANSGDTIFGQAVPDEQNIPLNQQMPPNNPNDQ